VPDSDCPRLAHAPIGRLLLEFSLPAIVGMTAVSLYNVIDRIFIGRGVGALAISGLSLTLPLMNLGIAFGALVGAGASTLVSIRLGEGRREDAQKILGTMVVLNAWLGVAYSGVMLLFLDQLLTLFGASAQTLPFAQEFMQVALVGNVFFHSYMGLNNVMRASGHPRQAMGATLVTVGMNLLLAPLFIFVFRLGIRGAALATVLAQLVGLCIVVHHFAMGRGELRFARGTFRLEPSIIKDIFAIGASPLVVQLGAAGIAVLLNRELARYGGDMAVGAFGIINGVLMLLAMLIMGLSMGMQPIVGFNFGARLFPRVLSAFRYTLVGSALVATLGFLLAQLFAGPIVRLFTDDPALIARSEEGMRLVMMLFPLVGLQIVTSQFFQSIGRARVSILLSLSRQVGFLLPMLVVLPRLFALRGVWVALPAADMCASVVTFAVYRHQRRAMQR